MRLTYLPLLSNRIMYCRVGPEGGQYPFINAVDFIKPFAFAKIIHRFGNLAELGVRSLV